MRGDSQKNVRGFNTEQQHYHNARHICFHNGGVRGPARPKHVLLNELSPFFKGFSCSETLKKLYICTEMCLIHSP